jgi:hypothetical protein
MYSVRKVRGKDEYEVRFQGAVHAGGALDSKAVATFPSRPAALEHKQLLGGKLTAAETKGLISASYAGRKAQPKTIGSLTLDPALSRGRAAVYVDPKGHATVVHRGTKGTVSDWANNAIYALTGNKGYKKTSRYKAAEAAQKAAREKYGTATALGHSQGAISARILNKKGIASDAILVNPASRGEAREENEVVVKSRGDVVSALQPTRKGDLLLRNKTFNPLAEHSGRILSRTEAMIGKGMFNEEGNEPAPQYMFEGVEKRDFSLPKRKKKNNFV